MLALLSGTSIVAWNVSRGGLGVPEGSGGLFLDGDGVVLGMMSGVGKLDPFVPLT